MAEKEVAPPHLPRPVSERAVLLKTGRASEESSVSLQPSLAAMGKVAARARVLLHPAYKRSGIRVRERHVRHRRDG
jgi:hypothetical protein